MPKTFNNLPELTSALSKALVAEVSAQEWPLEVSVNEGVSSKSCSHYVYVSWTNDDGDYIENERGDIEAKVSFTDHNGGNHQAQETILVNGCFMDDTDEDGEYLSVSIEEDAFAALVASGLAAVRNWHDEAMEAAQ